MKKLLIISLLTVMLILSGCQNQKPEGENPDNYVPEQSGKTLEEQIQARDEKRLDNLGNITFGLGNYYKLHEKYPEADETWCADNMVNLLVQENLFKEGLKDPQTLKTEGLEECVTGIYYYFRDDNPDYYTFSLKVENRENGNSDLTPQEVQKSSLEELKEIRLNDETLEGDYYHIIGNYPLDQLYKKIE